MPSNSVDNPKVPKETRDKMFHELEEATMPLIDFLYKYYHPHATIMITQTSIEVVEGDMAFPIDPRD
jgi:hypothetical protein